VVAGVRQPARAVGELIVIAPSLLLCGTDRFSQSHKFFASFCDVTPRTEEHFSQIDFLPTTSIIFATLDRPYPIKPTVAQNIIIVE
jgi:hypothetical protein